MAPAPDLLHRLPPEGALLLLCAGPAANDAAIGRLAERPALDWSLVLWLAERERATSLLWRRIDRLVPGVIPAGIRPDFQRRSMIADFTSSYLEQRTGETLAELAKSGIQAVLLKGAALASTVFHGFADRPMGDVDILIDERRVEEAWRIARKCGWIWDEHVYPLDHYVGHHHLPPLIGRAGTDVKLEMHAALFVRGHPFALGYDDLLDGAREVAVGPGVALVPRREVLLLHVAMHHAWSHMMAFGGWRALRDTAALAEGGQDWERLAELALVNRAGSAAYWTLRLARDLAGAVVPEATLSRLSTGMDPRGAVVVARHLATEMLPGMGGCPSHRLRRMLWVRAIQPGRMGHGRIRPWLIDDSLLEGEDPPGIGVGVKRAARQLRRIGSWWSYARHLVGRARGAPVEL